MLIKDKRNLEIKDLETQSPTLAPTDVPNEISFEKPDVWKMPITGAGCGCEDGHDHDIDYDYLQELASDFAKDPEWMTHNEIIKTAMEFWAYDRVCEFFRMVINDSATAMNGAPALKYRFSLGVEILIYFSKIWNGCPEEVCEGDDLEYVD